MLPLPMKTKTANANLKQSRRVWILVLLIIFICFVIVSTGMTLFFNTQVSGFFIPTKDSMDDIQFNTAEAHLWLEEYLAGDTAIDIEQVIKSFDEQLEVLQSLRENLQDERGFFIFGVNQQVFTTMDACVTHYREFTELTRIRSLMKIKGGAGTKIDQEYDQRFKDLLDSLETVNNELDFRMKQYVDVLGAVDNTLKLLTILNIIIIFIVLHRYITERHRFIRDLSASNSQLDAANQQLAANEQQLRASNQQLSANEQQLRASNQQLSANEQQLRASNQQLMASEQQLRATNQQLSQNQQELLFSEARFRQVVENIPAAVAIYERSDDIGFVIKGFNRAAELIENVSRDSITGRPLLEIFPGVGEFGLLAVLERVWEHGQPEHFPVSYYQDQSIQGWRDNYVFKLPSGEIVAVYTDETKHKKAEEELQKAQKLESLGILAGGIAHDFNNLLGAIFGYIEMAYESCDNVAEVCRYLEKALSAYHRAKDLTQQLLTFSRGGMPKKETIPLEGIISDALDLALSGSNVRSEIVYTENLWLVEGDAGQLTQVFSNLFINARQAMPEGGRLNIQVENRVLSAGNELMLEPGRYLEVFVRDEGTGIQEDILTRIFDPFFTTKKEGQGLGLATVYSIIKKHGGHIVVSSMPEKGTEFKLWLPATDEKISRVTESEETLPVISGRVLVMDDEEIVLDMVCAILQYAGMDAIPVQKGEEALKTYRQALEANRPFDLVILDLTIVGGFGGIRTIQELKKINPDVKAIVASGYSSNEVLSDFHRFGFTGAVTKPFRKKDLVRTIANVLRDAARGTG